MKLYELHVGNSGCFWFDNGVEVIKWRPGAKEGGIADRRTLEVSSGSVTISHFYCSNLKSMMEDLLKDEDTAVYETQ